MRAAQATMPRTLASLSKVLQSVRRPLLIWAYVLMIVPKPAALIDQQTISKSPSLEYIV
jgi:hypothetical protein